MGLWKILKGDGNEIGSYIPRTLAKSPLPTKLRASNLMIDDALYNTMFDMVTSASADGYDKNEHTIITRPVQQQQQLAITRALEDERQLFIGCSGTGVDSNGTTYIMPNLAASQLVASLDMAPLAALNPQITHLLIVSIFNNTTKTANVGLLYPYLETLSCLPPTRPSFDLMGRLTQDTSPISLTGCSTVADLIRMEVLERFIHECIAWLERAEVEEREGIVSQYILSVRFSSSASSQQINKA